jgi:hypothetical protein
MNPPDAAVRRLVLVPVASRDDRSDAAVRRFRLARLRLEGRPEPGTRRFEPIRRSFD